MKKLIVISICMFLFSGFVWTNKSYFKKGEDDQEVFYELLEKSLNKLKEQKNAEQLYSVVNELNRLGKVYPKEWLSDYYVAYLDLKLALKSKGENQINLLKEAKMKIDKMRQNKNADLSEITTLEGYYYYALIVQNPSVNGQKYYKEVMVSCNKAIGLNKANPRPALLLCLFKHRMSKFMGGRQESFCQDLKDVENLFSAFKLQHKLFPNWGRRELKIAQEKSCSQYE